MKLHMTLKNACVLTFVALGACDPEVDGIARADADARTVVDANSLVAFTPTLVDEASDPLAGISLHLDASRQAAVIELEDGTLVDLELGPSQLDSAADACQGDTADSDRHVMEVLSRPLTVGDRTFAAPVLETGCAIDAASGPTVLREADAASCENGECISFATLAALADWRDAVDAGQSGAARLELTLANQADTTANTCQPSNLSCVSCGGGLYRTRNVQTYYYPSPDGPFSPWWCHSTVTYGSCMTSCAI